MWAARRARPRRIPPREGVSRSPAATAVSNASPIASVALSNWAHPSRVASNASVQRPSSIRRWADLMRTSHGELDAREDRRGRERLLEDPGRSRDIAPVGHPDGPLAVEPVAIQLGRHRLLVGHLGDPIVPVAGVEAARRARADRLLDPGPLAEPLRDVVDLPGERERRVEVDRLEHPEQIVAGSQPGEGVAHPVRDNHCAAKTDLALVESTDIEERGRPGDRRLEDHGRADQVRPSEDLVGPSDRRRIAGQHQGAGVLGLGQRDVGSRGQVRDLVEGAPEDRQRRDVAVFGELDLGLDRARSQHTEPIRHRREDPFGSVGVRRAPRRSWPLPSRRWRHARGGPPAHEDPR